jgi:hypothetical protein
MKVIKKGPENAKFGKKLTCKGSGFGEGMGGCGAVLHVVPADISNNLATGGDAYWFICPCCRAKTFVSYNTFK